MEKNSELIIRYLSDLMSSEEKSAFELKLKNSEELRSEMESFGITLSGMNLKNIEADERYFAGLLPKVRERVEKQSVFLKIPKLAYAAPTLVLVTLIVLFTFRQDVNVEISSVSLIQEIIKNLDDEKVSQKYLTELELDVNHAYDLSGEEIINQPMDVDELTRQKILSVYESPINEEALSSQNLSVEELNNIYTKIDSKKSY